MRGLGVPEKRYSALVNLAKLVFWSILSFKNLQDYKVNIFLVKCDLDRIERIHFAESSCLIYQDTEKEVLLPITQMWKEDTL